MVYISKVSLECPELKNISNLWKPNALSITDYIAFDQRLKKLNFLHGQDIGVDPFHYVLIAAVSIDGIYSHSYTQMSGLNEMKQKNKISITLQNITGLVLMKLMYLFSPFSHFKLK